MRIFNCICIALISLVFLAGCISPQININNVNNQEYVFSIPTVVIRATPDLWNYRYNPDLTNFMTKTSNDDILVGFLMLAPGTNRVVGKIVAVLDKESNQTFRGSWDLMGCDRTREFVVDIRQHAPLFRLECGVLPKHWIREANQ
ncbi:hypothetical protein ACPF04_06385 [Campylobacter sp. MOP51]|uniref:hypothetical protein n=1 Tax=Campylobacter canis TaxID=3378588 RepID=UPI003C456EDB